MQTGLGELWNKIKNIIYLNKQRADVAVKTHTIIGATIHGGRQNMVDGEHNPQTGKKQTNHYRENDI